MSKIMVYFNNSHLLYLLSSCTIILMIIIRISKAFSSESLFHDTGHGYILGYASCLYVLLPSSFLPIS